MPSAAGAHGLASKLKVILDEAVQSGAVVGVLFAAIDRHGTVLAQEAAGLRALGRPEPMDEETYFPLYSMTKVITSIAAMQLIHSGKLTLDGPIDEILPELRPGTLKLLSDAGDLVDIPPGSGPTLRMLLAHVSGFAYSTGNEKLAAFLDARDGVDRLNEFSGEVEPVFGSPLVFPPGTSWAYGTGLDWVGRAIERATGMSPRGVLRTAHLRAAQHMAFRIPDAQRPNLVGMHTRLEDGALVRSEFQGSVFHSQYDSGGHGAFGTPHSFLLVLAMLLNEGVGPQTGNRVLPSEAVQVLPSEAVTVIPSEAVRVLPSEAVREIFCDQGEEIPAWRGAIRAMGIDLGYNSSRKGQGLSFQLNLDDLSSGRRAYSGAWAGAANSYYAVDPTSGIAHVFMVQSAPAFDPVVMEVWRKAETALYESLRAEYN